MSGTIPSEASVWRLWLQTLNPMLHQECTTVTNGVSELSNQRVQRRKIVKKSKVFKQKQVTLPSVETGHCQSFDVSASLFYINTSNCYFNPCLVWVPTATSEPITAAFTPISPDPRITLLKCLYGLDHIRALNHTRLLLWLQFFFFPSRGPPTTDTL